MIHKWSGAFMSFVDPYRLSVSTSFLFFVELHEK